MEPRPTPADEQGESDATADWLALALVGAFMFFVRIARRRLGLPHGETCPKCRWKF